MKTLLFFSFLLTAAAQAGRTSADYAIAAEVLDYGGQRTVSADYTVDGSSGVIVGLSSEPSTVTMAKQGYAGQLYDVVGYGGLLASSYYPEELGTTQLFMEVNMDDATRVIAPPVGFSLSVLEGPLSGISDTGLVTAGPVFENTEALVAATSDVTGQLTLPLYVQDTVQDNFGNYAGDGIGDDWQVLHFGADNPLAGPLVDADHDGQNNGFEFTAGLLPLDPASRFELSIEPVPGWPGRKALVFTPRFRDRSYVVKQSSTLAPAVWEELVELSTDDEGDTRTVTDMQATGARKFYHVEITKP